MLIIRAHLVKVLYQSRAVTVHRKLSSARLHAPLRPPAVFTLFTVFGEAEECHSFTSNAQHFSLPNNVQPLVERLLQRRPKNSVLPLPTPQLFNLPNHVIAAGGKTAATTNAARAAASVVDRAPRVGSQAAGYHALEVLAALRLLEPRDVLFGWFRPIFHLLRRLLLVSVRRCRRLSRLALEPVFHAVRNRVVLFPALNFPLSTRANTSSKAA